jgi:S-formylglutathione hydrolase FrmB
MIRKNAIRAVLVLMMLLVTAVTMAQSPELKTVEFASPSVGRTLKYNILLPRSYASSSQRYPVLYLLHGLTQNYTVWGLQNGAPFYAGFYSDLIVVMIDGGNSWYVNWTAADDRDSQPRVLDSIHRSHHGDPVRGDAARPRTAPIRSAAGDPGASDENIVRWLGQLGPASL